MNLILHIALTHVLARARQTLVAIFGVATGVGFAIMIAAIRKVVLIGISDGKFRAINAVVRHACRSSLMW